MLNKIYEKVKEIIKEYYILIIIIIGIIGLYTYDTGYMIEIPGGFINLEDRISIDDSYESSGQLGMAYVSMINGKLPFLILSKFIKTWDAIKESDLTIDDETIEISNKRDKLYMDQAVNNAKYVAYTNANKEVSITKNNYYIVYMTNESSELQLFDEVLKVDDTKITCLDDISNAIENKNVGDTVNLEVKRNNDIINVASTITESEGKKVIGMVIIDIEDIETSPEIEITVKDNEVGPSGGLMMSLAIYNELVEEDITKGYKIIGTGTISKDGTVGEIGGVKYKLLGAVKNKADIFLVPKENLEEAENIKKEYNYDIKIIGVSSFTEALEELKKL